MGWTWLEPNVEITSNMTRSNAWANQSLAGIVPAGTTVAAIYAKYPGSFLNFGTRPTNSTANLFANNYLGQVQFNIVPLDANLAFSGNFSGAANANIWLAAYANTGNWVVPDYTDKSLANANAYYDINLANELPANSELAFFHVKAQGSFSLRANDDSWEVYRNSGDTEGYDYVARLDSGRVAEGKISSLNVDWHFIGGGSDLRKLANVANFTSNTAGWTTRDLANDIPSGTTMVFLVIANPGGSHAGVTFRANANCANLLHGSVRAGGQAMVLIGVDANRSFQSNVGSTYTMEMHVVGYPLGTPDPVYGYIYNMLAQVEYANLQAQIYGMSGQLEYQTQPYRDRKTCNEAVSI